MSNSLQPHGLTAACQAFLFIINSWSLLKPMSIESVMPSNHPSSFIPFFFRHQSFPASGSFQMSQLFTLGGQNIGVSASPLVLPMNMQDWFPLGCPGWISLLSNGLSRVFSNTTVQKQQFFPLHFPKGKFHFISVVGGLLVGHRRSPASLYRNGIIDNLKPN